MSTLHVHISYRPTDVSTTGTAGRHLHWSAGEGGYVDLGVGGSIWIGGGRPVDVVEGEHKQGANIVII